MRATLRWQVTDRVVKDGVPVQAGVTVKLEDADYIVVATATTDAQSVYTFDGLTVSFAKFNGLFSMSKHRLRECYADEPAWEDQLKLDPAEVGQQHAYRPLDYLDQTARAAILNDCLVVLVTEFGMDLSLLHEDTSSSYFEGERCPSASRDTVVIVVPTVRKSTTISVF